MSCVFENEQQAAAAAAKRTTTKRIEATVATDSATAAGTRGNQTNSTTVPEFEPSGTQNNNPSPLKDNGGEIHSRHQPMFSVLIGDFTIRARFVTVFMYLDLSQRRLSDNDYNEMVVVVYGEISRFGWRESSLVSSASVRRRKLHLGLLSDLKRFPLTMPFSLARKVNWNHSHDKKQMLK
ncbi:hypothetical protein F2Q68_00035909 [Brassica cretica]|uniref:Uncharacterized protein n=1 Tax=Brassica cretica TaxID=69181 RepID=A0A8S9H9Q4_BRACR|nr:hypothetical protein F2Q68_00035909 [Brassica cretica]